MPTYGYHCKACQHIFDQFQKISDPSLVECPQCHQNELLRGPGGGIGLAFKGTGFYITDYNTSSSSQEPISTSNSSSACCPCGKNQCSK